MLWTYNPMSTAFLDLAAFQSCVYHCVDEIAAQPGMPVREMVRAETELLKVADVCFFTAPHLLRSKGIHNRNSYYFPNVADFGHFSKAMNSETELPADLAAIPGPRVGFVGAISGYKVDLALIVAAAREYPTASFILIGQVGEGDPNTDVSELRSLTNVYMLGPRSYADLPGYLKGFQVAIIPGRGDEYAKGMFPMKFFEYLAAGCPVVAANVPALREYGNIAFLAESRDGFLKGLLEAMAGKVASLDERVAVARTQTYEARTRRMLDIVESLKLFA
jgi:glycosyltransferase involved in cell wall biosynthesis